MKALKVGVVVLSVTLMVCGCNSPQDNGETTIPAETTTEKIPETTTVAETTIEVESSDDYEGEEEYYSFEKDITNGNVDITMIVDNKIKFLINAKADSTDKATIMYLAIINVIKGMENTDALVIVDTDSGSVSYTQADGELTSISSTDKNGNTILALPDWLNQNIDMTLEDNVNCYNDVLNVFSEFALSNKGVETSDMENVQETTTNIVTTTQQNEDIEILAEYTLADGIGWYTYHFLVIKNNTNKTLNVKTSSKAYAEDGSILSVANSEFDALGSECTSVITEAFETSSEISSYDTKITTKTDGWYDSVIEDLSYTESIIKDGVIYEVTNNGDKAAEFVEGYVLFFNGNNLADWDYSYFTDDDYEIKPGDTISKQLSCYKAFDRVEFYLDGRR